MWIARAAGLAGLLSAAPAFGQTGSPPPPGPSGEATASPPSPTAPAPAATTTPPPSAPENPEAGASPTANPPATPDDSTAAEGPAATELTGPQGDDAWLARDREVNEANELTGGIGLLRTQHAETGAPGQFRLSLVGEWFSAGFLCTPKFQCPGVNGGPSATSDTMNHSGATLSLGVSLVKLGPGVLEAYAATSVYANSDTANSPSLLQVLGDSDLSLKYAAPLGDVLRLGAFTELWLINASGTVGLDSAGTSARFGGVATGDFRGTSSHIPLRVSTNVVYSLDNTGEVIAPIESAAGAATGVARVPITRIERYGLGINRVDHVDLYVGAESLLLEDRIRPFVEAHVLIPTNRQKYECEPNNPSGDLCLQQDKVAPTTLTFGLRVFPWKRGFSLLAALDVGLVGTANFIEELQPLPPWTLFFGAGWSVDTEERPPAVRSVEKVVVRGRAVAHVSGVVHETGKNQPVADAIVTYRDQADLMPLATTADGKFGGEVPVGKYTVDVKADGYKPGSCDFEATKVGQEVDVDCALEPLPRLGTVTGHVRDATTNLAVAGIPVVLTDSQKKDLRATSDSSGAFRFDNVLPGATELGVIADGYLALFAPADVRPRQESGVDLLLRPVPKKPKVEVTAKEIAIRDQIQFALDSSVILPQSFGLLTEVADTLIRHGEIKRVEVQGHTDNSGAPEHNRALSQERAEAVSAWLVQHGVSADRLEARGYGQEKPLVPNVTEANRGRNRRVQFIILDRGGEGTGPGGPAPAAAPSAPSAPAPGPAGAAPPPRKPNPLPGF
jgi:outer membrane protein OmpA-like peptidoglycan-associated protein